MKNQDDFQSQFQELEGLYEMIRNEDTLQNMKNNANKQMTNACKSAKNDPVHVDFQIKKEKGNDLNMEKDCEQHPHRDTKSNNKDQHYESGKVMKIMSDDSDEDDFELDEIIYQTSKKLAIPDNHEMESSSDVELIIEDELNPRDALETQAKAPDRSECEQPCCQLCQKPIVGMFISSNNSIWHPEHFNCSVCQESLIEAEFYEIDNRLYCETDYNIKFAEKCVNCGEIIKTLFVESLGMKWHPEHFTCTSCGGNLLEKENYIYQNEVFCQDCYAKKLAFTCARCQNLINSAYVVLCDKFYHQSCFTCSDCNCPLDLNKVSIRQDKIYCLTHSRAINKQINICEFCRKEILSNPVLSSGKYYHAEHYVCLLCKLSLSGKEFVSHQGGKICDDCMKSAVNLLTSKK